MTNIPIKSKSDSDNLASFIRDHVLADHSVEAVTELKEYIRYKAVEHGEFPTDAFCDFLELGDWFREAMVACDFDVERFMEELETQILAEEREAAEFRADAEDDYKTIVGQK
jgi:hypothetical protein